MLFDGIDLGDLDIVFFKENSFWLVGGLFFGNSVDDK